MVKEIRWVCFSISAFKAQKLSIVFVLLCMVWYKCFVETNVTRRSISILYCAFHAFHIIIVQSLIICIYDLLLLSKYTTNESVITILWGVVWVLSNECFATTVIFFSFFFSNFILSWKQSRKKNFPRNQQITPLVVSFLCNLKFI